jgi:hypothetical protein
MGGTSKRRARTVRIFQASCLILVVSVVVLVTSVALGPQRPLNTVPGRALSGDSHSSDAVALIAAFSALIGAVGSAASGVAAVLAIRAANRSAAQKEAPPAPHS